VRQARYPGGIPHQRHGRHSLGIPLGRFGTTNEIAKAVVFLASDESAFAVGSDFVIDGGGATL
jgi:NAD(P)-dependent dehydrogenase (short-subunit alcohol dehydrogenase family)